MYILASASPRRKELLNLITSDFAVDVSNCEEICPEGLPARECPEYLASLKAREVASRHGKDDVIIAADTAVFLGDRMLGKPADREEARDMLRSLSGNTHTVITGCCVIKGEECRSFSVATDVEFYTLSDREIESYIETGECYDKAGAYGIQSGGALLVRKINGDYFNVVGLPVAQLFRCVSAL